MYFFLLFAISISILNSIPDQYYDIVAQAKSMAKVNSQKKTLLNDQEILYPGSYQKGNFRFELNNIVTGDGVNSLRGYGIDSKNKVAAIISARNGNNTDFNTANNTVM